MGNITFAIIKPDAVKKNYTGEIYNHILKDEFNILASKLIKMSKKQAEGFYEIHREKPLVREDNERIMDEDELEDHKHHKRKEIHNSILLVLVIML